MQRPIQASAFAAMVLLVISSCGDVEGELILGDIKKESIRQIWSGKRAREIRQLHSRRQFESLRVCQVCCGINADWAAKALEQQRAILAKLDSTSKVVGLVNTMPIVRSL